MVQLKLFFAAMNVIGSLQPTHRLEGHSGKDR